MTLDLVGESERSDEARGDPVLALPLKCQCAALDGIAAGAPLEEVFESLIGLIEEQTGDMRCAVLLADEAQQRLRVVAAPSIPAACKADLESLLQMPPNTGPVRAATDPLRSLWSAPILSRAGVLLGSFAMYYVKPRLPSEYHIGIIDLAVQLARLAIENRRDELPRLRRSSGHGTLLVDLAGDVACADAAFAGLLGYEPRELQGRNIALLAPREDHDDLVRRLLALDGADLVTHRVYRARDGRKLALRERWTLRRNAAGHARHACACVEDATVAEQHPLGRLSARERQVLTRVVAGQTSKQIGAQLRISATSVDTYRSRVMEKLGAKHLSGLIRFAIENGLENAHA